MPTLASTAGHYAHCSRKPLSFIGRLPAECEKRVELRIAGPALLLIFSLSAGSWKTGATVQNLPQEKPTKGGSLSGSQFVLLGVLLAILIVTIVWATAVWTSSNNVAMSKHGWIALGLGTFFSLVIGCGLMALMFYSSRSGHDDAATPKFVDRRERTYHDTD